jgi:hypothetical protein
VKKIAQNVAQTSFSSKLVQNIYRGKSSPKNLCYLSSFEKKCLKKTNAPNPVTLPYIFRGKSSPQNLCYLSSFEKKLSKEKQTRLIRSPCPTCELVSAPWDLSRISKGIFEEKFVIPRQVDVSCFIGSAASL